MKGEVVSAETSQTTESLRSGTWRDSWLTFGGGLVFEDRKLQEASVSGLPKLGILLVR